MRRPAFTLSLFFGAGIYLSFLFQPGWVAWVGLYGAGVGLICLLFKEKKFAIIILCCVMLGGLSFRTAQNQAEKRIHSFGTVTAIQGEVLSVEEKEDYAALTIATDRGFQVLVSVYQKNPNFTDVVGKWIWASGDITLPPTAGNPGGFDYRLYLRSIGTLAMMQCKPDQVDFSDEPVNRLNHDIATFRHDFEEKLARQIGERQTNLTVAMMFGDKSGLEDDMYESFQRNGTAHILSVSGLHVGFLYGILAFLAGGKRKPIPSIIIMLILIFYGVLSGFCPPITRSLLMIGFHIFSKVTCRSYDLLSSAGVASFIILIQNPYSLFQTGFQLSFLAVILMGWIFPIFPRILPKGHWLSMVLPMPVLQAALSPFTAFTFNYFSMGAFVANFGVVFFSSLLVPAGLLAMIANQIPGPFFPLASGFVDVCIRCIVGCNDLTYAGGKTCFDVVSPSVFCLVAFYGIFFFFLSETGRILWHRRKYQTIGVCLVLLIITAGIMHWKTDNGFDKADGVFVDVGQGDCLHIRTPYGKNILIDGGGKESFDVGKRILKPYLLKNGVGKVDLAIITHLDIDHYGGIRSLATDGMIDRLGLYDGNHLIESKICKETGLSNKQLIYLHQGDNITVDPSLWLEFIYPARKSKSVYQTELAAKEENPRSLVIRVHLGDYNILMTGDLDTQTEAAVLSLQRNGNEASDILKICHHGSKYSTSDDFLQAVDPQVAVVQVGKNNYGHPAASVLEKCQKKGIMIYRNDKDGAIGLFGFFKDQAPYFRTVKKGN
jgi:competence protein ComEC